MNDSSSEKNGKSLSVRNRWFMFTMPPLPPK
jgi:hypothetical protein